MNKLGEELVSDWQEAGLLKPSVFKPILATIENKLVLKQLGGGCKPRTGAPSVGFYTRCWVLDGSRSRIGVYTFSIFIGKHGHKGSRVAENGA